MNKASEIISKHAGKPLVSSKMKMRPMHICHDISSCISYTLQKSQDIILPPLFLHPGIFVNMLSYAKYLRRDLYRAQQGSWEMESFLTGTLHKLSFHPSRNSYHLLAYSLALDVSPLCSWLALTRSFSTYIKYCKFKAYKSFTEHHFLSLIWSKKVPFFLPARRFCSRSEWHLRLMLRWKHLHISHVLRQTIEGSKMRQAITNTSRTTRSVVEYVWALQNDMKSSLKGSAACTKRKRQ